MKRLIYIVPVILFLGLAGVLFHSLTAPPPGDLPSVLIDKPAPTVSLPALDAQASAFTPADFRAGHVTVLNVFASWCAPCREEAPVLQALAQTKNIALYGMVQKDTRARACPSAPCRRARCFSSARAPATPAPLRGRAHTTTRTHSEPSRDRRENRRA